MPTLAHRSLLLALLLLPLLAAPVFAQDCNANGVPDAQDIDPTDPDGNGMVSPDCNANLRPDECEFPLFVGDLYASDGQADDRFGSAVAASGTAVLIGAPNADIAGSSSTASNAGAAYVFRKGPGGWVEEQKLVATSPVAWSNFGYDVALDGNVAVVAADVFNPGIGEGVAYVFRFDGNAWLEEAMLMPTNVIMDGDVSVAVSGDAIFVCSPYPNIWNEFHGVAVAFRYDGVGWIQEQAIVSGPHPDYEFGSSVALEGNRAVIGREGYLAGIIEIPTGGATVYEFNGTEWVGVGGASGRPREIAFGREVELAGDTMLILGASSVSGEPIPGYTFFNFNGTHWARQSETSSPFPPTYSFSIALNQMYAAVNRTTFRYSGSTQSGVQIFENGPDGYVYSRFVDTDGFGIVALADNILFSGRTYDDTNGENAGSVKLFDITAANDCNANEIPDTCELDGNDCDGNGVPDDCQFDCNNNGVIDDCEPITDCNDNLVPDECELVDNDCNANGVPDECETDCNHNDVPDDCETFPDCNDDGIPDSCQLGADCNGNGVPDACEQLEWQFVRNINEPTPGIWKDEAFNSPDDDLRVAIVDYDDLLIGNPDENDGVGAVYYDCEYYDDQTPPERFDNYFSGSRFGSAIVDSGYSYTMVGYAGASPGAGAFTPFMDCYDPFNIFDFTPSLNPLPLPISADAELGASVASDRYDSPMAGAPGHDINGAESGAVYVFEGFNDNPLQPYGFEWIGDYIITPTDGSAGQRFGQHIDITDDVMAVSAPGNVSPMGNLGAVYIFRKIDDVWTEEAKLTPDDTSSVERFGPYVAIEGDHLIVGTPQNTFVSSEDPTGPVAFRRVNDVWAEESVLIPPPPPPMVDIRYSFPYGFAPQLSNGMVAFSCVGSLEQVIGTIPQSVEGYVVIFRWTANGWIRDAVLSETEYGMPFRLSNFVDLNRHTLAVAGYAGDNNFITILRRCGIPDVLGDIDSDGDIDTDDAAALAAVLVGTPQNGNHVDRSDLNDDGIADGRDIALFVNLILN